MEDQILEKAIKKLQTTLELECKALSKNTSNKGGDTVIPLLLNYNHQEWKLYAEVKRKVEFAKVAEIENRMKNWNEYLLIADYISNPVKKILKEKNINYIDTIGNIFFQNETIYIYIETNQTNRQNITTGNRAFNKAGLKVVYQFLIHPEYINLPYRFIAKKSTVTIDTVGKVMKDLLKENYLLKLKDKEYVFNDRKRLLEEWVSAYNKYLKPKIEQRTYRFIDKKNNWDIALPEGTFWGGGIAAEKITNYLIAEKGIIYTDQNFNELAKSLKLIPDKNGNIVIAKKFWNNEEEQVHPILIYADVLSEYNPRYIETANKIYKDHVETYL